MAVPVKAVERAQAQCDANPLERPEVVDVRVETGPACVLADGLEGRLKPGIRGQGGTPRRAVCRSARLGRDAAIASPISPAHDIASDPGIPTR